MKFFSRMLSSAGSKSSPTSSIKRGRPRDKLSSKWFLKYLWFSEVIWGQNKIHLLINGYMNMFASSSPPLSLHRRLFAIFQNNLMRAKFEIKRQNIWILLNYPIKKLILVAIVSDTDKQIYKNRQKKALYSVKWQILDFSLLPPVLKKVINCLRNVTSQTNATFFFFWMSHF